MATIDVTEIINATPAPSSKRPRLSEDVPSNNSAPSDPSSLLAALESGGDAVELDETQLKRLVAQLEKKSLKNREMRIKHADDPQKFMESEVDLNVAIQELTSIAAQPELFSLFISLRGPQMLVTLLAHENTDIVAAVLNLVKELLEDDGESGENEEVGEVADAFIESNCVDCMVSALSRLDESINDDAEAAHNALAVIEALLELRPELVESEAVSSSLFQWLLKRACQRGPFDANKLYASEILALVLQQTDSAKKRLSDKVDGIDLLLRALATYKKHDPQPGDEREFMENVFDALCAALMMPENRSKFLEGEGLQLMNLMLKSSKLSRQSALKVLDHATSGPEGAENCAKFIEILGLRTIFPLFMRTPAKAKRKDSTPDEHEEHVCAILASLMRSCDDNARLRVMQKFVEHEHEKVDRGVELLMKYREKVEKFEKKRKRKEIENDVEEDPIALYLDRLDVGLYTLQNVAVLLAEVCAHTNSARLRALKLFKLKTGEQRLTKHLVPILTEYQENLGDDADKERNRMDLLIAKLTAAEKADALASSS